MKPEQIQQVPLDQIVCRPQVRERFDETAIGGLTTSLQEVGQLQPILVRREGTGYIVVDGERRLRAARQAKRSSIAAIVVDRDLSEVELLQIQTVSNVQRVDLSPVEKARAIDRLIKASGWSASETAKRLGLSAAAVTKHLALLDLPPEILERVESGHIAASTAYELAKVADPEAKAALASAAAAGMLTREAAINAAKRARSAEPSAVGRIARAAIVLGAGRSVTIAGVDLTMDRLIAALEEILSKARRARTRGWGVSTFVRAQKDQSKEQLKGA